MIDLDRLSDHDSKQSGRLLPLVQRNMVPASSGSSVFVSFSGKTGYMIHIHVSAFMNLPVYSFKCSQVILHIIHLL